MTTPRNILYSFRRCPYAMRARMALAISGQSCALREVVLREKPPEMLKASAKGTVPILVLPGGDVLDDSYPIMKWALKKHDPDGWLRPETGSLEDIDQLVVDLEGTFKFHLDRYKYPPRYENVDPLHHRNEGVKFLQSLEDRLRETEFLFGDHFTIADAAVAPFVRQFAHTDKDWFDALDLPRVHKWLAAFLNSDLFAGVMQKYPKWQAGDEEPVFPSLGV